MSLTRCSVDGCTKAPYARGMCCAHYAKWKKSRPPGTARPRPAPAESDPAVPTRISLPEFLASLAAAVPPLPGARCRGHVQLYDDTTERSQKADTREARSAALGLCSTCPALDPCRTWLDTLPADHRPIGVVAGRIINPAKPPSLKAKNAERNDRFAALHQSGMSHQDIASATGFSKSTVQRVLTNRENH